MKKYLAYYETEWPANITELTAVENKPFVGYLGGTKEVKYTVIPEPITGPLNNEIWYTSSDGNVITPYKKDVFGANIVSNTYENGKGIIAFDGDVTSIGGYAFYSCSSLTSITIPNNVTYIDYRAFAGCTDLTSITILDSVTNIGNFAFWRCSGLISVTIPNSVKSIGDWAFEDCSSLKSITFKGTIEEWNAITKGNNWDYHVPAAYVQCTDGQATL